MNIIISKGGECELKRLKFDIVESINDILKYVPYEDMLEISHILVTDSPSHKSRHNHKVLGSYFRKNNQRAYIELYLKNLFGHIKSSESFEQMFDIQTLGLAQTIYHEIGHHLREIRTHGIKKGKRESFAESYARRIQGAYVLDKAQAINSCFKHLKSIAESEGLSLEIINNMESGWQRIYEEALKETK
ncbi:MAG: hypothetical protein P8075_19575 [Deltaproteobacteria bacterium]|jgi:hypothetical protein